MAKERFLELDALRGIAAFVVVLFHFTMHNDLFAQYFRWGVTGVDLFFIISGFVILFSIKKVSSTKQFVINRISRLYPTYWACVTVTALVIILSASIINQEPNLSFSQYIVNLTMFQYYFKVGDIDTAYWTLIVEMIFYIFMALLFRFKLLRYINTIFFVTIITSLLILCFFDSNYYIMKFYRASQLLQFLPLFFAGSLFYQVISSDDKKWSKFILIVFCYLFQLYLFDRGGQALKYIEFTTYAITLLVYFSLFTLFVLGYLSYIVNPVTLYLGKISFPLYLLHQRISVDYILPWLQENAGLNFWISFGITLTISILIASLISSTIEFPLSKKIKVALYSKFVYKTE